MPPNNRLREENYSTDMAGFRVLEHPSDLGIHARGRTLSEALAQAARGLLSVICDLSTIEPRMTREISVQGSDVEQLVVRWLSEILYLYDGRQFLCCAFTIHRLTDTHLESSVQGEPLDLGRHKTRLDVKAVTYHQLSVREEGGWWLIEVFLDI